LHRDRAAAHGRDSDNLHQPGRDLSERAATYPYVRRTSLYTKAQLNPRATAAVLAGVGAFLVLAFAARTQIRYAKVRSSVRRRERERAQVRESKLKEKLHEAREARKPH
jgi:hypothetical protein